jgi:hypothetical protein
VTLRISGIPVTSVELLVGSGVVILREYPIER